MRLAWPLPPEFTTISQRFGEHPEWYAPHGLAGHEGEDFPCPVGTPTFATHDGWTEPRWRDEYGDSIKVYGDPIKVYGDRVMTFHAHLSHTSVAFGQTVRAGEEIGKTGSTGRSTGPHLHFAVKENGRANPGYKDWLDPEEYLRGQTMSKLNPHFQRIPEQLKVLWTGCQNEWYKVVIPPIDDPFPGKRGIGRPWIGGDDVENEYIRDGAVGAERYFARLKEFYLARPYIWAWESPNEPHPMGDPAFRALLGAFLVRWIELMHGIFRRTVIWCFSVGWVDVPEDILDFVPASLMTDYAALHEYGAPTMQTEQGWHCLRYRRTVQALKDAEQRVPPLLITECGIDGGVLTPPQAKTGWKAYARDEEDYMGQLAWYDRELCQDDYVEAAFIFTSGPEAGWVNFDVNETLTKKLVAHINSASQPPSVAGPLTDAEKTTLRLFFGTAVPATLKDAIARGREFVGEVPGSPNLYVSWDAAMGRYEMNKLDIHDWHHLDDEPL